MEDGPHNVRTDPEPDSRRRGDRIYRGRNGGQALWSVRLRGEHASRQDPFHANSEPHDPRQHVGGAGVRGEAAFPGERGRASGFKYKLHFAEGRTVCASESQETPDAKRTCETHDHEDRKLGAHSSVSNDAWYATHIMADLLNEKSNACPHGSLVSRFQWDARLHAEPGEYAGFGRPRIIGERIPNPRRTAKHKDAEWVLTEIIWYGGKPKKFELLSGEGLWYRCSQGATWVRWVIVRDPDGKRNEEIFFTTDRSLSPAGIVECYVRRWSIEVTFEEARRHLGIETLRNRTHNAVNRSVPFLLSLYSLIIVWFSMRKRRDAPRTNAAPWYRKRSLTFSDLIECAKEDILNEYIFLQDTKNTTEFLLAPFPLNIVYGLLRKKTKAA